MRQIEASQIWYFLEYRMVIVAQNTYFHQLIQQQNNVMPV